MVFVLKKGVEQKKILVFYQTPILLFILLVAIKMSLHF